MFYLGGVIEFFICLVLWKTGIGISFMRFYGWENLILMIVGSLVLEVSDLKFLVCIFIFKFI